MGNSLVVIEDFDVDVQCGWGLLDIQWGLNDEEIQEIKEKYFRKYLNDFVCEGTTHRYWVLRKWDEDSFWRFQQCLSCLLSLIWSLTNCTRR